VRKLTRKEETLAAFLLRFVENAGIPHQYKDHARAHHNVDRD
jgi:hypothetical protein